MKILLTGGSGTLGQELQKHISCFAPSHKDFDITNPPGYFTCSTTEITKITNADLIVHCAAYTNVLKAEIEQQKCYKTNVVGTNLICSIGIPVLYISTEYVFEGEDGNYSEEDRTGPINHYAQTKLLGENEVLIAKGKVIRCLFKKRPFKHDVAPIDQYTTGDYVDVIAKEIALAIRLYDKLPPIIHIGTTKKSTFNLAKQSRKDVQPIRLKDIKTVKLPKDTSLCLDKWKLIKLSNLQESHQIS